MSPGRSYILCCHVAAGVCISRGVYISMKLKAATILQLTSQSQERMSDFCFILVFLCQLSCLVIPPHRDPSLAPASEGWFSSFWVFRQNTDSLPVALWLRQRADDYFGLSYTLCRLCQTPQIIHQRQREKPGARLWDERINSQTEKFRGGMRASAWLAATRANGFQPESAGRTGSTCRQHWLMKNLPRLHHMLWSGTCT